MAKIKLADALLIRKELNEKLDRLKKIDQKELFEMKSEQVVLGKDTNDAIIARIDATVPKVTYNQVSHAYDWHAKQLRLVDAVIQQTNWTTEVDVPNSVTEDYQNPNDK